MAMSNNEKMTLAAAVLNRGKQLAPDRFPQASPETARAWAQALSGAFDALPVQLWPEAVDAWATEFVGDRMATPKDLRDAAYVVRDRWENDHGRRQVLEAQREARRVERDHQLATGKFGQLRGYVPREQRVAEVEAGQVPAYPLESSVMDVARRMGLG